MSNAHPNRKGKRKGSATYKARDQRTKNKATRVARDARRAKRQACGHGIRYRTHPDGRCRRCFNGASA